MKRISFIYFLRDPRYGTIRYVGYSYHPDRRVCEHVKVSKKAATHRDHWIAALLREGFYPMLHIVEEAADAPCREIYWIARLTAEGCSLTNSTAGGEGTSDPTSMTRAKMSESGKRRAALPGERIKRATVAKVTFSSLVRTKEWRDKIGAAHRGKVVSPETRAKMSESAKQRGSCPEERLKRSKALKALTWDQRSARTRGRVVTEETKRKLAASFTEERRNKHSEIRRGSILTPEHVAKLRAGHAAYFKTLAERKQEARTA